MSRASVFLFIMSLTMFVFCVVNTASGNVVVWAAYQVCLAIFVSAMVIVDAIEGRK